MHAAPKIELAVGRINASEPKLESNQAPEVQLDAEGRGVKALCGAAQECRHLLDGTIYPPGKDCRTSSQPQSLLAFPPHSALATRTYAMLASYLQGVRSGHHKALAT